MPFRDRFPPAREALALAAFVVAAGIASILAGQDANWDLRNYHLYNAWAWLTGRYGFDLAPAQLQTFHNATGNVPFYLMVAADWPPRVIAFVQAVPAGVAAYFVARIAGLLVPASADRVTRTLAVAAAVAIGVTGANGVSMLGNTMNEWMGAALVAAALWLILRALRRGELRASTLALAGFVVGLACGLKLTAATFAVGIAVALAFRRSLREALRDNLAFGLPLLAGFALAAGPWMALLQAHYGSPMFPYFNELFRSPLLPPEPVLARTFGPRAAVEWLTLPFDLLRPPAGYVAELRYRDARFPVLAGLILAAIGAALVRARRTATAEEVERRDAWRFFATFGVVSFAVWAAVHAIFRYLLALEILTGVAIAMLLFRLVPPRWYRHALLVAAVLLIATTRYPNWGRTSFGASFFEMAPPAIEADALVVLTADAPMSFVLTRFPPSVRHVGVHSNVIRAQSNTGLRARAAAIVASHPGPIHQLTTPDNPAERELAAYGLARTAGACAEIRTNLDNHPLLLCRLARAQPGLSPGPGPALR